MRYDKSEMVLDVRVIDVRGLSVSAPLFTRAAWLLGWSVTESTGLAVANVQVIDGGAPSGQLIATLPLTANGLSTVHPGDPGWPLEQGLFLNIISGTVTAAFVVGEWIK